MSREPLPDKRKHYTQKAHIDGHTFYLHYGEYPDGRLGEIFITAAKAGTALRGNLDALARLVSVSLQCGVSVEQVVKAVRLLNFKPQGLVVGSPYVGCCTSVPDWLAQEIEAVYVKGRPVMPPPPEPVVPDPPTPLMEGWVLGDVLDLYDMEGEKLKKQGGRSKYDWLKWEPGKEQADAAVRTTEEGRGDGSAVREAAPVEGAGS